MSRLHSSALVLNEIIFSTSYLVLNIGYDIHYPRLHYLCRFIRTAMAFGSRNQIYHPQTSPKILKSWLKETSWQPIRALYRPLFSGAHSNLTQPASGAGKFMLGYRACAPCLFSCCPGASLCHLIFLVSGISLNHPSMPACHYQQ